MSPAPDRDSADPGVRSNGHRSDVFQPPTLANWDSAVPPRGWLKSTHPHFGNNRRDSTLGGPPAGEKLADFRLRPSPAVVHQFECSRLAHSRKGRIVHASLPVAVPIGSAVRLVG